MEQWHVLKKEHLPGYITWDQYLCNLQQLAKNAFRPAAVGATRAGSALLGGVIGCGRCGKRMSVVDSDRRQEGRYVCHSLDPRMRPQSLQASEVDRRALQQVLDALRPSAIELSLSTANEIEKEQSRLDAQWQQRIERAAYDAQRAQRHYQLVEPENRLVARELEKCWEETLREQQQVEEEYARFQQQHLQKLSVQERASIEALASDIPALWHASTTTYEQRKTILRHLIEHVAVHVLGDSEVVDLRIGWAGGFESCHEICRSVQGYDQLQDDERLRDRLLELRLAGKSAQQIAELLNQEGFRTARGKMFGRHHRSDTVVPQRHDRR